MGLCFQPDGTDGVYDGPLKALPLREALDEVAAKEPVAEAQKEATAAGAAGVDGSDQEKKGAEERPKGVPSLEAEVHTLTVANLSGIDAGTGMWLIGFYSSAGERGEGGRMGGREGEEDGTEGWSGGQVKGGGRAGGRGGGEGGG